jgi:hypothetical protein
VCLDDPRVASAAASAGEGASLAPAAAAAAAVRRAITACRASAISNTCKALAARHKALQLHESRHHRLVSTFVTMSTNLAPDTVLLNDTHEHIGECKLHSACVSSQGFKQKQK